MRRLNTVKEAKRRARQKLGQPPKTKVILDKRFKSPKHTKERKEEYGFWFFHCDDI